MFGNQIIVSTELKGVYKEGIAGAVLYPGELVEVEKAAALKNGIASGGTAGGGLASYVAKNSQSESAGNRGLTAVVLPDEINGYGPFDQIPSGGLVKLYCPAHGEELNVQFDPASGTGTGSSSEVAIGDQLEVNTDGRLEASAGTPQAVPFTALEAYTATQAAAAEAAEYGSTSVQSFFLLHVLYN